MHSGMLGVNSSERVVAFCTTSFNIEKFYILPTGCVYVFCVDIRRNSDYFTVQRQLIDFCTRNGVYCAVRTEYINKTCFVLTGLINNSLRRAGPYLRSR